MKHELNFQACCWGRWLSTHPVVRSRFSEVILLHLVLQKGEEFVFCQHLEFLKQMCHCSGCSLKPPALQRFSENAYNSGPN